MSRDAKLSLWRCRHYHPALVTTRESSRQAQCLRCGTLGPPRPNLAEAMRALRELH